MFTVSFGMDFSAQCIAIYFSYTQLWRFPLLTKELASTFNYPTCLKTAVYMSGEYYLDQVKKCVTFIYNLAREPLGTGFFVGIKLENGGGDAVYFVTAKHVLSPSKIFPPPNYYDALYIRLNLIGGTSEYMGLPLSYAPEFILNNEDENIDLAAMLLNPPQNRYDYMYIPQDYFTDSDILQKKNIREGSNVLFAGLFPKFAKKDTNYPVVRFGKIALMTNEKIEINKEGANKTGSFLSSRMSIIRWL
jgi:hypothetical protein